MIREVVISGLLTQARQGRLSQIPRWKLNHADKRGKREDVEEEEEEE